ncbi:hypothetical protein DL89DRAFT_303789 [Linderina pennispora]|uniref:Uncharacterized protein n=1 Tax=Linderina pennispora TaxID=61395 RepID=A0A1Y1W357_9FUNG|nr:uncharacterized protein DL89DRAFT_303789 [Linderina pennispora]ORX67584.1 hypothetical protein DL89DRAFT_303789 [Linderina pennispora]
MRKRSLQWPLLLCDAGRLQPMVRKREEAADPEERDVDMADADDGTSADKDITNIIGQDDGDEDGLVMPAPPASSCIDHCCTRPGCAPATPSRCETVQSVWRCCTQQDHGPEAQRQLLQSPPTSTARHSAARHRQQDSEAARAVEARPASADRTLSRRRRQQRKHRRRPLVLTWRRVERSRSWLHFRSRRVARLTSRAGAGIGQGRCLFRRLAAGHTCICAYQGHMRTPPFYLLQGLFGALERWLNRPTTKGCWHGAAKGLEPKHCFSLFYSVENPYAFYTHQESITAP